MNPYGPNFRKLAQEAKLENDGLCRFCGIEPSSEAHHALPGAYPEDADLRADQLTALCSGCHAGITSIRKWQWRFNASPCDVWAVLEAHMGSKDFLAALRKRCTDSFRKVETVATRQPPQRKMRDRQRDRPEITIATHEPQREMRDRRRGSAR